VPFGTAPSAVQAASYTGAIVKHIISSEEIEESEGGLQIASTIDAWLSAFLIRARTELFSHRSSGSYRQQHSVPGPSKNRPVLTLQSFLTSSNVSLWLPLIPAALSSPPLVSWHARVALSIGIGLAYVRWLFLCFISFPTSGRLWELWRYIDVLLPCQYCSFAECFENKYLSEDGVWSKVSVQHYRFLQSPPLTQP
jgi:hypothetical protein